MGRDVDWLQLRYGKRFDKSARRLNFSIMSNFSQPMTTAVDSVRILFRPVRVLKNSVPHRLSNVTDMADVITTIKSIRSGCR